MDRLCIYSVIRLSSALVHCELAYYMSWDILVPDNPLPLLLQPLCIQFGHREIFIFATVVYTAGAIGCACAQTSNAFIALR